MSIAKYIHMYIVHLRSLACIKFTCIHLCYQLTQAVGLDLTQYKSICIYIDLCKYRLIYIELDRVLLPELAGNTDVYK